MSSTLPFNIGIDMNITVYKGPFNEDIYAVENEQDHDIFIYSIYPPI